MTNTNNNNIILIIIAIGIFICAFFLYDNYSDKQKVKESLEAKIESERVAASEEFDAKEEEVNRLKKRNMELLKSGQVCKGRFNPKLHQWVFNNRSKEACLIVADDEYFSFASPNYNCKGFCTNDAVVEHLGDVYTRYANQDEVDNAIMSIK
jgi:hypothetical protein